MRWWIRQRERQQKMLKTMNDYVYQPTRRIKGFEKCVAILRRKYAVVEEWVNNIDPEILSAVEADFARSNVPVIPLSVNEDVWQNYVKRAEYGVRYPDYYPDSLPEKSFEHFMSLRLLEVKAGEVFVDVASENSPVPKIYSRLSGCVSYRQDIMYVPGFSKDKIGGDACNMPIADGFADKIALTCSLEHFEHEKDRELFAELSRVLKPGGRLCIVPLYMFTKPANQTDPTVSVPAGVEFDRDVAVYCAKGWVNRFARFYSVESLIERLLDPSAAAFTFTVFKIMNADVLDRNIYARWALVGVRRE